MSSTPGLIQGQVPTPAQWNSYFAAKQDTLNYTPMSTAGGVLTGLLTTMASALSGAGLNIAPGVAPTSPNNGDMWTTAAGVFSRVNGVTVALGNVASLTLGGPLITTGTGSITLGFPNSAATYSFPASSGTVATLGTIVSSISGNTGAFTVASPVTVTGTNVLGFDVSFMRGYLSGLILSGGGSQTLTINAGIACSDDFTTLMKLPSTFTKTFASWAVGSGNGGLDTGAVAINTWYHTHLIERIDTGVVDVLLSFSPTAPTLPANYTKKRRIGSIKTDAGPNIVAFLNDGDLFQWLTDVADVSSTNPGTSAVTATLPSIPLGVRVEAILRVNVTAAAGADEFVALITDLSVNDQVPSTALANVDAFPGSTLATTWASGAELRVMTSTSQTVRTRISASGTTSNLKINTHGWIDTRGRFS